MLERLKTMFLKKLLFHKKKKKELLLWNYPTSFTFQVQSLNSIRGQIQEQTQGYQSPPGKGIVRNFYYGADSYKEGKALSAYLWLKLWVEMSQVKLRIKRPRKRYPTAFSFKLEVF